MSHLARKCHPGETPMVRKVFKLDNEYVCSLCRSIYGSYDQAHQCLESCWHAILNLPPVLTKRSVLGVGEQYCCRYCGRDYLSTEEATLCARECRQHKIEQHQYDAEIFRNNRPVLILRDADFLKKSHSPLAQPPPRKFIQWKRSAESLKGEDNKAEIPPAPSVVTPAPMSDIKPTGKEEDAEFRKTDEEEDELV